MPEQLIRLYESSGRKATCRGCGAPIVWFETLAAKHMPMNAGAVPRKSENDPSTRRVIAFYAAEDSHFATCPDRSKFSRKAR